MFSAFVFSLRTLDLSLTYVPATILPPAHYLLGMQQQPNSVISDLAFRGFELAFLHKYAG